MDAVVKVFLRAPRRPISRCLGRGKKQYSSSSSGLVIEGRRVLTNAHSVDHHTQRVLTVSDDEFWEGISPVKIWVFACTPRCCDCCWIDAAINSGNSWWTAFNDKEKMRGHCISVP
ncbi:hypothetical protein GBA52_028776 [Prunus armeniaca]|nr:hypothetical protein GBA52_028776 [Prunus armeniaca]